MRRGLSAIEGTDSQLGFPPVHGGLGGVILAEPPFRLVLRFPPCPPR